MIDIDNFYTSLISATSDAVGAHLSTIPAAEGRKPSVTRMRTNAPRPDPTFITIDLEDIWLPSGWLLCQELDENNNTEYTILYEMQTVINCYGSNSKQILQQLHSLMTLPNFRYKVKSVTGASISDMGTVRNIPQILTTDYEERAELIVRWYIHDVLIDANICEETPDGEYFDLVSGQGTLKVGVDGNDILVNFDATTRNT